MATRYTESPLTAEMSRTLPAFVVIPACVIAFCSFVLQANLIISRLRRGKLLIKSSRTSTRSVVMSPLCSARRTAAMRSRTISGLLVVPHSTQKMPKTIKAISTARSPINKPTRVSLIQPNATIVPKTIAFLASTTPHQLKHRRRQFDTTYQEAIAELWTYAGGDEVADDLSGIANAALVEHKNVLHGDNIAFHAGDFGYV